MRHAPRVRRRYLAIEHELPAEADQTLERHAEQLCPIEPVPTDESQAALAVDQRNEPVPIVLEFVQPSVAGRRFRSGRGELERDPLWQRRSKRPSGKTRLRHDAAHIGIRVLPADLYWGLPAETQRGLKAALEAIVAERAKEQGDQLCVLWEDPGGEKRPGGL